MRSREVDPYAILGVPRGATLAQIKERHRLQVLMKHPDRFERPEQKEIATEDTKALNAAWYILSDPDRRRAYDDAHPGEGAHVEPPHPYFRPAFLDFGRLHPGVHKTLQLYLHNDGAPATAAQIDLSVDGSWFTIDIGEPTVHDGDSCLKIFTVTACGPGGQGTLNEWISITLDSVTARADLRMTAVQGPVVAEPTPPKARQADPPVAQRFAEPLEKNRRRSRRRAAIGVGVLLVLGLIGMFVGLEQEQKQRRIATAPDPWIAYRDGLVEDINNHSAQRYPSQSTNELQVVLREVTRHQMRSSYVTQSNAAFMRHLFERTGPCNPNSSWHCQWYPAVMRAQVLDHADILVTGFMRSAYPLTHERDDIDFSIVFRRIGDHWTLVPPATFEPSMIVSEAESTPAHALPNLTDSALSSAPVVEIEHSGTQTNLSETANTEQEPLDATSETAEASRLETSERSDGAVVATAHAGAIPSVTADQPTLGNADMQPVNHLASFIGVWRGTVKQRWARGYSVVLVIEKGQGDGTVGTIEYPELDCGGSLRLIAASVSHFRVAEILTYGKGRCVSGGEIAIDLQSDRRAAWKWTDDNPNHMATAILKRD